MPLSRSQKIIIGAAVVFVLIILGIFVFGSRRMEKVPNITFTVWGTEKRNDLGDYLSGYQNIRSNISIKYVEKDPASYESELINALAAGSGPDVFMFKNAWLPKHFDKISPAPAAQFGLTQFRQLFPFVAEQDFVKKDLIYALPLYIDTLALYYNQGLFEASGIALPPANWSEFQLLVSRLRKTDSTGNLIRPAAALGGSSKSMDQAADILGLLMLQSGVQMTDANFTRATFGDSKGAATPGLDALNFYLGFSNPNSGFYTWNDNLGTALNNFAQGKLAMMLDYGSRKKDLKKLNPSLRYGIAPAPQPSFAEDPTNYPSYWGFAVSKQNKYSEWGWDFIIYLATNSSVSEKYLKQLGHAPALRTLIQKYADDPEIGVFAKQALTARSWPQADDNSVADIFSQMIASVNSRQSNAKNALLEAQRKVNDLMK